MSLFIIWFDIKFINNHNYFVTFILDTAVHTMHACQMIGMPECDVMLGQCVIYLCKAKKINFFNRLKSVHQLVTDNLNN